MSNETYNQGNSSYDQKQDAGQKAQQQMIDSLTQMSQSIGMSMKGNAISSIKEAVFGNPKGHQAMDNHDTFASQKNQSTQLAKNAVEFAQENPELLVV